MLTLQYIREHADELRQMLIDRNTEAPLDRLLELDESRRKIIGESEVLKARQNEVSRQIGKMKERPPELLDEMRQVRERTKLLDEQQRAIDAELADLQLRIPNVPHPSVPIGKDDSENVEVRKWGEKPEFD